MPATLIAAYRLHRAAAAAAWQALAYARMDTWEPA